ncbi:Arginine biosynthesis bifunctional protein ArgJ [Planctomycetes bacterium Poly30]|uniref:Arginine biosynthesis bifunctional protein ArgJ n=1 Tax=Saltatorellus ferox TaxID=2528018 RepID=A0A518EQD0_9BACT|nr:Arginine biosynthesis bifunctional protein ArgJ [Planctomycetes bacterium Poly30]
MNQSQPLLPRGFRASAVHSGIRKNKQRLDLALMVADEPRPLAAVFTKSLLLGAHIPVSRASLEASGGHVRAIVVNAGNANCSTGPQGLEDNRTVTRRTAERLGCAPEEVLFFSTGVIGALLPMDRILTALPGLCDSLSEGGAEEFSRAIMTTDLVPKMVVDSLGQDGDGPRLMGFAKGSGMIHPDMATMFGFLLTDASLGEDPRGLLQRVNGRSFQRMTVDGDTSPNDSVVLWGTGLAGEAPDIEPAVTRMAQDLARKIAADGEGATRLLSIRVTGAPDEAAAVLVGRTVGTSPLVKTAVHGRDPNWGRIVAAAARAGVPFDPQRSSLRIGGAEVYRAGVPCPENENAAHEHMLKDHEVRIELDLAAGTEEAECWTCDYSADYVRINADYRS